MKILLGIPDRKASSILEVLRGISYVKTSKLTDTKAELMQEIREAVVQMKLVKKGRLKARPVEDILHEL